ELRRAREALDQGNWTAVISHADSASEWMPWSSEPDKLRGDAYLGLSRPAPALLAYISVARASGGSQWQAWLDVARASTGQVQQEAARKALSLNPLSAEVVGFCQEEGIRCRRRP